MYAINVLNFEVDAVQIPIFDDAIVKILGIETTDELLEDGTIIPWNQLDFEDMTNLFLQKLSMVY